MTIEGHAAAMRACIADSCRQGRKTCYRSDCEGPAVVARIKSSTPLPELPITMEESSPLANWRFWVGGAVSVLIWTAICYGAYWVRS